jgi:hypothetical protein
MPPADYERNMRDPANFGSIVDGIGYFQRGADSRSSLAYRFRQVAIGSFATKDRKK